MNTIEELKADLRKPAGVACCEMSIRAAERLKAIEKLETELAKANRLVSERREYKDEFTRAQGEMLKAAMAKADDQGRRAVEMFDHALACQKARGQGVPDSFRFAGTDRDACRMIGDGVSVDAARWLGGEIKRYFS